MFSNTNIKSTTKKTMKMQKHLNHSEQEEMKASIYRHGNVILYEFLEVNDVVNILFFILYLYIYIFSLLVQLISFFS